QRKISRYFTTRVIGHWGPNSHHRKRHLEKGLKRKINPDASSDCVQDNSFTIIPAIVSDKYVLASRRPLPPMISSSLIVFIRLVPCSLDMDPLLRELTVFHRQWFNSMTKGNCFGGTCMTIIEPIKVQTGSGSSDT